MNEPYDEMSSAAYCRVVFVIINVCGFIGRGKFLYETRVIDSSYLRYKVQLPTFDSSSTEITAGGIKVRLEGSIPLDAP